ncbi:MAG: YbhB/YbcL family Raf kinase inhibitor-like protein [Methanotrichaceae archaeon]
MGTKNLEVKLGFSQFPAEYTCKGRNVSPKIGLSGLNAESMNAESMNVKSIAIIMDDPDASPETFTHWVIWNIKPTEVIPGSIPNTANVTKPIEAVQGKNSEETIGYFGPCPPPGKPHRYFLRFYGLDSMLDLRPGSNRTGLEKAMVGHVIKQGEAMAIYGR